MKPPSKTHASDLLFREARAAGLDEPDASLLRRVMARAETWPPELAERLGWGLPGDPTVNDALDNRGLIERFKLAPHSHRVILRWLVGQPPAPRADLDVFEDLAARADLTDVLVEQFEAVRRDEEQAIRKMLVDLREKLTRELHLQDGHPAREALAIALTMIEHGHQGRHRMDFVPEKHHVRRNMHAGTDR